MSILCCCLCYAPCVNEFKYLQNDLGECNEIYKITVMYFDPMLLAEHLNTLCSEKSRALCNNCWLHIQNFNDFHQTIIKTRASLEQTHIQKLPLEIKVESEQITTVCNAFVDEEVVQFNKIIIKTVLEEQQNHLKSDNKREDQPFKILKSIPMSVTASNEIRYKETDNRDVKEVLKSYKLRKSKNVSNKFKKLYSDDEKDEEKNIPKNKKKDPRIHPALEKGRKYDDFITEWKSHLDCDICSETFPIFDSLKSHFKDKHSAKAYVKCCERKFFRRCSLVEHIRLHINPDMHKCNICGKVSGSKYTLMHHKKTIHEESQQFECEVCHKIFKQKQNLKQHLLTHLTGNKDFKCTKCDKAYVLETQLKKHIKMVHNDHRVCEQCGKTLHGLGALKNHLKEHSGSDKPKYPCEECGAKLGSRITLKRHKASYHNDGSTVYVCSICGKVSSNERALKNHKKYVHEIERKHTCPHCNKAFKRSQNLQEHIATHTGEALYQCSQCPRTFKINSKYHEHRKNAHPVEWEEGRKNRLEKQKINYDRVKNQVVI